LGLPYEEGDWIGGVEDVKFSPLKFGKYTAPVPIVQGGMAVKISTAPLAAAVANEGGIGLIGASGMTEDELRREIRLARELSPNGIIGVNVMVAARAFSTLVKTAIDEKIDLIAAGAGFSRDVFALAKEADIPVAPIVSSAKLAKLAEKLGASMIIVEGKEAGGHLGTDRPMLDIVPEIIAAVNVPVIAAGGIISGADIAEALKLGASGVQMGTRFAASEESNAAPEFKELYLKAKDEDVVTIQSPVGYQGRSLKNPFAVKALADQTDRPSVCQGCLKECSHRFCLINALIRAQQGDVETGLVFTGENVARIEEILSVKEIFRRLTAEIEAYEG